MVKLLPSRDTGPGVEPAGEDAFPFFPPGPAAVAVGLIVGTISLPGTSFTGITFQRRSVSVPFVPFATAEMFRMLTAPKFASDASLHAYLMQMAGASTTQSAVEVSLIAQLIFVVNVQCRVRFLIWSSTIFGLTMRHEAGHRVAGVNLVLDVVGNERYGTSSNHA